MRYGKSFWRRLGGVDPRPGTRDRPERAVRPGGADEPLEGRRLMTLQVATYAAPSVAVSMQDLTNGADGNLWFTEPGVGKVGKMTTAGVVTEYALPAGHNASGAITPGPDGNLWFTETDRVGRVTPSGQVTEFDVGPNAHPTGIVTGSDGNVWFLDADHQKIGRVTPEGAVTEFPLPPSMALKTNDTENLFHDLTAGPDGNLWYTAESYDHRTGTMSGLIGRVTTEGVVSVFNLPKVAPPHHSLFGTKSLARGGMLADAITAGPDGNLWFTEHQENGVSGVGRISPGGKITQFQVPRAHKGAKATTNAATPDDAAAQTTDLNGNPPNNWIVDAVANAVVGKINQFLIPSTPGSGKVHDVATDITAGPDGNLWFNLASNDFASGPAPAAYVGRVTPAGKVTVMPIPKATDTQAAVLADGAESITTGPDGRLWFTATTRRNVSETGRVLGAFKP